MYRYAAEFNVCIYSSTLNTHKTFTPSRYRPAVDTQYQTKTPSTHNACLRGRRIKRWPWAPGDESAGQECHFHENLKRHSGSELCLTRCKFQIGKPLTGRFKKAKLPKARWFTRATVFSGCSKPFGKGQNHDGTEESAAAKAKNAANKRIMKYGLHCTTSRTTRAKIKGQWEHKKQKTKKNTWKKIKFFLL